MSLSIASSGGIVAEAEVQNIDLCTKVHSKIGTGICFFDHMVDQFTSHGMLGVTLCCGTTDVNHRGSVEEAPVKRAKTFAPLSDYATGMSGRPHDRDIFISCGTALGLALRRVVDDAVARASAAATTASGDGASGSSGPSRSLAVFCSPLDEAFAEASVDLQPPQERCGRCVTSLEPYGKFAGASGRTWIGRYRTELTPLFWSSLAAAMQCDLSLRKVRGGNAHHQLESTFKSFARAFRAALDGIADGGSHGCAEPSAGPMPPAALSEEPRRAERKRSTKETAIEVRVDLDSPWSFADKPTGFLSVWNGKVATATNMIGSVHSTSRISSGIELLDRVLTEFAKAAGIEIIIHCEGDRHIDDHHTAEDIAITLGQCFHEALGDKAGLARMGCAEGEHGGARVRAVLDLSNRPHFESDLPFDEEYVGALAESASETTSVAGSPSESPAPCDALCGAILSCEMLYHVFNSLTLEMRSTCHLELIKDEGATGHTLDLALAAASAYGSAFSRALRVDPRRGGTVASSKGTLSK